MSTLFPGLISVLRRHKFLCLFILAGFFSSSCYATHIVGGELTYSCLGNNLYELRLVVYRDCYNGNPGAYFDNPAYVGVYNASGDLVGELDMPWLMVDDTLSPTLSGECLVAPPDVCVHTSFYLDTIELQPIPGGYELYYQRCCRNGTINNIISPLTTGATFGVSISQTAMLECNSSAQFNNWPPILICVNEPVDFDHSATDIDGDSLVYSLCTPLDGATQLVPYPTPPQQTDPMPVVWQPPYNSNNMLGGVPLSIDPSTGFLTGIPNTVGQFVVGVCVEEYRNGELISTTRRDFQYNVGVCGEPAAAFVAPDIQCGSLTVNFDNTAQSAASYLWLFNDPGNPGAFSTEENPSFTFSDTGQYTVMLIVNPGSTCADTATQTISLQPASLIANFSWEIAACSDTALIVVSDESIDPLSEAVAWEWTLSAGGLLLATSADTNPVFTVTQSQFYVLNLTVTNANGCSDDVKLGIPVDLLDGFSLASDSLFRCPGDTVSLNPNPNLQYLYNWSPGVGLSDPTSPNPQAFPDSSITYSVVVSSSDSVCQKEFSVFVFQPKMILIETSPDTIICAPSIQLNAGANVPASFLWSLNKAFSPAFAAAPSVLVTPLGETIYYVNATDGYGCSLTDSILIDGRGINIEIPETVLLCPGDTANLEINSLDFQDTLFWLWEFNPYLLLPDTAPYQLAAPLQPGPHWFFFNLTNQYGCSLQDSVGLSILDTTPQLDFLFYQQCGGYSVQFTNSSVNAPFLLWNFGDPSNPDAFSTEENPEYIYSDTGFYTITLLVNEDVACKDTLVKEIFVGPPGITVDFNWEVTTCSDSLVISFSDNSSNTQSDIVSQKWKFGDGQIAEGESVEISFYPPPPLQATLIVQSSDGCEDSLTQLIPVQFLEVSVTDTLQTCAGVPIHLFPDADTSLYFEWYPDTGLDNPNAPNPQALLIADQTYSLKVLEINGGDTCSVNREVTVKVIPKPVVDLTGDTLVCSGNQAEWTASSSAEDQIVWSVDPNFSSIIGVGETVVLNGDSTSLFFARVTNEAGCEAVDSFLVHFGAIQVEIPPLKFNCADDTLRPTPQNLLPWQLLTYTWSPSPLIIADANGPNPLVQGLFDSQLFCEVENQWGCRLTIGTEVLVLANPPFLQVFADPDTIFSGDTTRLSVFPEIGFTYAWTPANLLDNPFLSNPLAFPDQTTEFTVFLTDSLGCAYPASVQVVIRESVCSDPYIYLPNIFSPNGDGKNDMLMVRGNQIDEMHLAIYNRWGNLVYESKEKNQGWDGTFNGKQLNSDVFGYYLTVRCFNGQVWRQQGNITLLR